MMNGRGPPGEPVGLSRSLFRPSDDAVTLPYNVPGNAMACVELGHIGSLLDTLVSSPLDQDELAAVRKLVQSVSSGICDYLIELVNSTSSKLPFEIDGFGSMYFMDDANLPSLLSLPLTGLLSPAHPVYLETRKYVLSPRNPYFFSGSTGEGVGGPHVGYGMIWPMATIVRAMTAADDSEVKRCLDMLKASAAGTGFMHEAYNVSDVSDYTRDWFAWANGLFGELIIHLIFTKPYLVLKGGDNVTRAVQSRLMVPISLLSQNEALVRLGSTTT
jgi:uncharacterized protein